MYVVGLALPFPFGITLLKSLQTALVHPSTWVSKVLDIDPGGQEVNLYSSDHVIT